MLGAALAISAYNVIQRLYANGYTSLQITAYSFFTATVMLAAFCRNPYARSSRPLFPM